MEEPPETKIDGFEANSHSSEAIIEPQQAGAGGEFALTTDHTFLEFPVELPTDEEESIRLSSEITSANPLTQEQLPSQTVLDNLDADTSSIPEFLAQLSNLGALVTPVISTHNAEGSVLSDFSLGAVPTENAEGSPGPDASAIAPSAEQVEEPLVPGDSTTAQSIENAEDTIAPDASAAIPSTGQVEEPLVPDPSVTAQPTENAEDPLTPDVSASAVALDSVDQVGGEQTNVIPSLAQPKAKRKRRTAKGDQVSATMRQEEQGKKS